MGGAPAVLADERDDKIRELEKRLEVLERKYQALEQETRARSPEPGAKAPAVPVVTSAAPAKEAAATEPMNAAAQAKAPEAAKSAPVLSVGSSGFKISSADSAFALRFRGLLQFDYRAFLDDEPEDVDTFTLRRARTIFEGVVFRDFDFQTTLDFGGSQKNIVRDAWLNYRYDPALQLRVGKMKPPGNLERWESAGNTFFIERAGVSALSPSRDLGVMFHGELWPGEETYTQRLGWKGLLNYQVGVFNGVGDGWTAEKADFDDSKAVEARVFVHPFLKSDLAPLKGFGVGLAGSYGQAEGRLGLPDGGGYSSEGQSDFFAYGQGVIVDGPQWRLFPQAYYYWGPFGLMAEYGLSSSEMSLESSPDVSDRVENTAWQVSAGYMLTGENATFKAVTPKRNFDPRKGGWGAWQVVARYSRFFADDAAFLYFADAETSADGVSTWGLGLNWYLNRNVRTSFDYFDASFSSANGAALSRPSERVFLMRFQLMF